MANPNVLLLDEPTNDFDIETLNVFENYLDDFFGVLIIVSHDRSFLDRCAEFIWAFEGNGVIKEYPGNYTAYLEKKEAKKNEFREQQKLEKKAEPQNYDEKSNIQTNKSQKLSFKEKIELERIDAEIDTLESRKSEIESLLHLPDQDYKILELLSNELNETINRLDEIINRWVELSDRA